MDEESPDISSTPSDKFFRHFQNAVSDLEDQITKLEHTSSLGGEHADAVDHCLSGIARLSTEVNDATSYLAAYDQRAYGEAVKALSNKLQKVRSSFAPKPRFAFKSKPIFTASKNESAISLKDAAELANQDRRLVSGDRSNLSGDSSFVNSPADPGFPSSGTSNPDTGIQDDERAHDQSRNDDLNVEAARIRQPSFSESTSVSITNHNNIHIMLPASASHAITSGTVSHIQRSVIDMSLPTNTDSAFAGLTLKNITSSLLICGHVNGAAHLTNIKNSVIVVISRQFRMHASHNCDVYLLTPSRPIIEDCSAIRFASAPALYMSEQDMRTQNQWSNVDDFKWLRQEASPNWSRMEEQRVIPEETWREVVPGGPHIGVEDILAAVNIAK